MKTVNIEQATLDACISDAQHERNIFTKNGVPLAILVGIEGLDEDELSLCASDEFWRLVSERRQQKTISRDELEDRVHTIGGQ